MKTDDLIAALAADTRPGPTVVQRLMRVLPVALAVTAVAFVLFWGVRPDLAAALTSAAVVKSLLPLGLAGLAGALALVLSRPEARPGAAGAALWALGGILLAALAVSVASGGLPALRSALSTPSLAVCLVSIPLIALPLLAAALWALSAGAPRSPAGAGAVAGLAAGGLAATIYSLYCDQDAVQFFLPAYAAAILIVAVLGLGLGARMLRW
ncbi:MAG: NrsF family protein [Gemmobacter sp.]